MRPTSGMKDGRPDPGVHVEDAPAQIVVFHGVVRRDRLARALEAADVRPEVEQGEQDGRGLLHPGEPPERPFSEVLMHLRMVRHGSVGDVVHACVPAFVFTRPSRETQGQGQLRVSGGAYALFAL